MATLYSQTVRPTREAAEATKRAALMEQIRELQPTVTRAELEQMSLFALTQRLDVIRHDEAKALRERRRLEAANA